MQQIYGFLLTLIIDFAFLNFYSRIKNENIRKISFYTLPILHGTYRFLTSGIIGEPLRIIASFAFFGVMLIFFEKRISWVVLLVAFLMTYILELFALLIAYIILIILNTDNEFVFALMGLTCSIVVFTGVILLEKYQKITLSTYSIFLESALVRKIVLAISVLVVMLYSFLHIFGIDNFVLSLILWGVSTILVLTIIFLIIFVVKYLNAERKKQQILEQENERLSKERLEIEKQMAELKQMQVELQQDFSEMTSQHHAYKYGLFAKVNA